MPAFAGPAFELDDVAIRLTRDARDIAGVFLLALKPAGSDFDAVFGLSHVSLIEQGFGRVVGMPDRLAPPPRDTWRGLWATRRWRGWQRRAPRRARRGSWGALLCRLGP